jgi:hypothetical protein
MSTKRRKVKRKFLLSMEELKTIDNMMMSDDSESRLLGLSLLETSALGKHYFAKGKIKHWGPIRCIINRLRIILKNYKVSFSYYKSYYDGNFWLVDFLDWINSKTY